MMAPAIEFPDDAYAGLVEHDLVSAVTAAVTQLKRAQFTALMQQTLGPHGYLVIDRRVWSLKQ